MPRLVGGNKMNNGCVVRIIKNELINFKNVEYGEIDYMNYDIVNENAELKNTDIVGIYGQNGSGKTAMVEALDILKLILKGIEVPYEDYEGLIRNDTSTKIVTYFFLQCPEARYKIKYMVQLQVNHEEKKINLYYEELEYWIKENAWIKIGEFGFRNPYYDYRSLLNNERPQVVSPNKNDNSNMFFSNSIQNLAVFCSQTHSSLFFNKITTESISDLEDWSNDGGTVLYTIIQNLSLFGWFYFQVVGVKQLGYINKNSIIPVNVQANLENDVMQGCIPLVMKGEASVPETVYNYLLKAIQAINIALKAVIPNMKIELEKTKEEINEKQEVFVQIKAYSVREDKKFSINYESEGIKRIISLLNNLISLYNDPSVCLVVDELDSGIFEYLLGEILGVLDEEAKGQLIFTSHNLRAFEKLNTRNIICSTTNPKNRYVRLLIDDENSNFNLRDFYIRTIVLGGQSEELYNSSELQSIGYAFRRAGTNDKSSKKIKFSDKFRKKLQSLESKDE